MIVEINPPIRQDVISPKTGAVAKHFADARLLVEIPEVSAEDAPAVLQLGTGYAQGTRRTARIHDGVFYYPIMAGPNMVGSLPGMLARMFVDFELGLEGTMRETTRERRNNLRPLPAKGEMSTAHRDAVTSAFQSQIGAVYLIVDGLLHQRTRSPLLTPDLVAEAFRARVGPRLARSYPTTRPIWFMSADELAKLNEAMVNASGRWDVTRNRLREMLDFEVLDEGLLDMARAKLVENTDFKSIADAQMSKWYAAETSFRKLPNHVSQADIHHLKSAMLAAAGECGSVEEAIAEIATLGTAFVKPEEDDTLITPDAGKHSGAVRRVSVPFVSGHQNNGNFVFVNWDWISAADQKSIAEVDIAVVAPEDMTEVVSVKNGSSTFSLDADGWSMTTEGMPTIPAPIPEGRRGGTSERNAFIKAFVREIYPLSSPGFSITGPSDIVGSAVYRRGSMPKLDCAAAARSIFEAFIASRMISVGDGYRLRCPEPVLAVCSNKGQNGLGMRVAASWLMSSQPGIHAPLLFRLDDLGSAADAAAALMVGKDVDLEGIEVARPDLLRFDSASWNLKVSMARILQHADKRMSLMSPVGQRAFALVKNHLMHWTLDAASVDDPAEEARFLRAADDILHEIQSPLYDDIGSDFFRTMATSCLNEISARQGLAATFEDDEEAFTFGM
jgi:hypothetical protein